jgi:hypothetical protein
MLISFAAGRVLRGPVRTYTDPPGFDPVAQYKKQPVRKACYLDAPECQFVDFCAFGALFNFCWDCTLGVTLTANREGRARFGVNDGDHFSGKTAKKLVIGLIPVCRQLTQFFEFGLWQFNDHVKPNIRMIRPREIASGVNLSGGHIQGRQSRWCRAKIQRVIIERAQRPK